MALGGFSLEIDVKGLDFILDDIQKKIENKLTVAVRQGLNILLQELKKVTPEDTRNMLQSFKVKDVYKQGNSFIGVIGNTADYAIYVEFGVDGKIYNYHKPKGVAVYSGIGNRTFQRALLASQEKIYKLIQGALG